MIEYTLYWEKEGVPYTREFAARSDDEARKMAEVYGIGLPAIDSGAVDNALLQREVPLTLSCDPQQAASAALPEETGLRADRHAAKDIFDLGYDALE